MRHNVDGRKFGRDCKARKALLRNLVSQLFLHDSIVTTVARAKEVRRISEKLITKARAESVHARRQVMKVVTEKDAAKRLFDVILAKIADRKNGGYTRILKLGNRKGDDAPMALLEILQPGATKEKATTGVKKKVIAKVKEKSKKIKKIEEKAPRKPGDIKSGEALLGEKAIARKLQTEEPLETAGQTSPEQGEAPKTAAEETEKREEPLAGTDEESQEKE